MTFPLLQSNYHRNLSTELLDYQRQKETWYLRTLLWEHLSFKPRSERDELWAKLGVSL